MQPVIIGAGPAGLTTALELSRHGVHSILLEADPEFVGGLSRTSTHKGFKFDIGGHRFFSKNDEIERLWGELLGDDLIEVERMSRIVYRGRFFDYPLKASNALLNLGFIEAVRCMLSYGWAQMFPRTKVVSFEDWVSNQFGWRLYNIFFKTYTEKVWGMPCTELSADWAAQRIKGLSLASAIKAALFGARGAAAKTLIERFRYPRLGPGMLWERVASMLTQAGSEVRLGAEVQGILWDDTGVVAVEYQRGEETIQIPATHVISSMALRHFVEALRPTPPAQVLEAAKGLGYRDFLTVALVVDQADVFADNWIYIHEPNVHVGRIQNYKNWSIEMVPDPKQSVLGMEYFCFEGDELWNMADDKLIELASHELGLLKLTRGARITDGAVVRMPRAYPVYDDGYAARVACIRDFIEQRLPNVQAVGRNGMHRYNNQDHAMLTGLLAARNIRGEGPYDPWKVNSDAEYLEEGPRDEVPVPWGPPLPPQTAAPSTSPAPAGD